MGLQSVIYGTYSTAVQYKDSTYSIAVQYKDSTYSIKIVLTAQQYSIMSCYITRPYLQTEKKQRIKIQSLKLLNGNRKHKVSTQVHSERQRFDQY